MIAQSVDAIVAFGSNLGDREGTIRAALAALAAAPGVQAVTASPLVETIALRLDGLDEDAPRYLNGVARVRTALPPHDLLALTQAIETEHGRIRGERWGDRTLDLDLIVYGGRSVRDERLTVPHPRAHERDFVLAPWLALDPGAALPGRGLVAELLAAIGDTTLPFAGEARP